MRPQEMPQHAKGQGIKGPMLYDITILTDNDTVAFMMTVCSKEPIIMEQADFISGDGSRTSHKIQKIYLNARKKYFVGRYRCQLTKAHLNSLYAADAPFIVDFGNNTQFAIKKGNWANEKRVYSMVYKLSELNK
jgi:hypothetical protein